MNQVQLAVRIRDVILEDVAGRQWEDIGGFEPETQREIRKTWKDIILAELRKVKGVRV